MKINIKNKGFVIQGVIAVIALVLIVAGAFYIGKKNNVNNSVDGNVGITIVDPMGGEEVRVGGTQVISYSLTGDIKPEYYVALIVEPGYVPLAVIPASQGSFTWTVPETMCLGGDACMPTHSGEYTIKAELYSEETCVGFCVRNENAKVLTTTNSNTFRITGGASATPEQTPVTITPLPATTTTPKTDVHGNPLPTITSITPTSASIGTVIEIKGTNFAGFEGDKYAWIENAAGQKGIVYGDTKVSTNGYIKFTLENKYCTADTSYSGNPCPSYINITPGTYSIYVYPWGNMSNKVQLIVK